MFTTKTKLVNRILCPKITWKMFKISGQVQKIMFMCNNKWNKKIKIQMTKNLHNLLMASNIFRVIKYILLKPMANKSLW